RRRDGPCASGRGPSPSRRCSCRPSPCRLAPPADTCGRTASRREASRPDAHLVEVLGRGTEALFVWLLAAEEVEDRDAPLDGIHDHVRQQDDAGREACVDWIESGVVEADRPGVLEAEKARDRGPSVLEEPEPRPSGGGQRAGGVTEEPLHLLVHETRLTDLGKPVKIEEPRERDVPTLG